MIIEKVYVVIIIIGVRHVTGNDKDYLRKIPRVVVYRTSCDLFHRLLHSYTRHIERVVRGERDTFLSAQD
jgi:hypothetical protein